jgi:hypothetical protein
VVVKSGGGDGYLRRWVFVGVISFGCKHCYTGPCSSSLALVVLFGWFR